MNALKNKQRDIFYKQTSFYFAPVQYACSENDTKSEVGVIWLSLKYENVEKIFWNERRKRSW
jgi:hypothetical protein